MVDSRIITRSGPSITNLGHASFRSTWHHISAALYYHLPGQPSTTVQRKRTKKKQVVPSDSFSTIQTLKGQTHMFEVPPKNPRIFLGFPRFSRGQWPFQGPIYWRYLPPLPQPAHPTAPASRRINWDHRPSHGSGFCAAEIGVLQLKSVLENYRNHKQSHRIHVWNIYQHLPHQWPKCR